MAKISLNTIVDYCDRLLGTRRIQDYERAANGLQVSNRGSVTKLAAAVDASMATVRMAVDSGANLLLVHHGLFWGPSHPWTGKRRELFRLLVQHDLAVYSSHLPLDAHPRLGNNARLCAALGLRNLRPFLVNHGQPIGFQSRTSVSRDALAARLERATGSKPRVIAAGPEKCRRIGVVSGGAGEELALAAGEGIDTYVTGEGPHWTRTLAEDLGVNVLYGGHYATETFGVKALAEHLSRRYRMPWVFLDHPSGL